MSFQVIINSLHIDSGQILVAWCIFAMYDFRNLLGGYGALGKTIDDDEVETFREVLQSIVFDKIFVWRRGSRRSGSGD